MKTELSSLRIGIKHLLRQGEESSNLSSTPINRAYNHALNPEYFNRYSKESSLVKEIGQYKK